MGQTWQLQEAKNKFSHVVDEAQTNGPQVITRRRRKVAVVLSMGEYQKLTAKEEDLGTFFMNSPLRGSGLKIDRSNEPIPERVKL
jgi:prevent-host-death family protein